MGYCANSKIYDLEEEMVQIGSVRNDAVQSGRSELFFCHRRTLRDRQDVSPIQSVPLGAGAKLSDTYEESQVIGSFKLVASNEEV